MAQSIKIDLASCKGGPTKSTALSIGAGISCSIIPAIGVKYVFVGGRSAEEKSLGYRPVGKLLLFMIFCGDAFTENINGSVRPNYD